MVRTPTLYEALVWRDKQVGGNAASGHTLIKIGEAGNEGPWLTLTAGVHGDEGPWGALAIRELLRHPQTALKGRLRVILAANPLAAGADSRNAPLDQLDLNRSFPGHPKGSHTERIAASLAPLIASNDVVIDLHGGGSWCVNAFAFCFPGSERLAEDIGAPFIVDVVEKLSTLTHYARLQGAKVLAVEMGGRSHAELLWRNRITAGLERVLYNLGWLDLPVTPPATPKAIRVNESEVLRPASGGIFVPALREEAVGTVVPQGAELGQVLDLNTLHSIETFTAPYPRTALLLLRPHIGVIEAGAMTYVIAQPKEA
jgi:predicted deacylase